MPLTLVAWSARPNQPLIRWLVRPQEEGVRSETPFLVVRIMRDGETQIFATGRYLDLYKIRNRDDKLAERIVVCDSSRIDTLLALPL